MSINFRRLGGGVTLLMLFALAAMSGTNAQAGPLAQVTAAPTQAAASSGCGPAVVAADLSAATVATMPALDSTMPAMDATMNAADAAATMPAVSTEKPA